MDYLCEINFARGEPAEPCAHGISTFVSREGWLLKGLFGVLRLKHEIENVRFSRRWAATLVRRDGAQGKAGRNPRGERGGGEQRANGRPNQFHTPTRRQSLFPIPLATW